MKVIQAIETGGPGGAEEVLLALSQQLMARGHRVEALLLKDGWLAGRLRELEVPTRVMPLAAALDRRFLGELTDWLKQTGADLLHSHEFTLSLYGRLACRRAGLAHVGTVHGHNFVRGLKRRLAAGLLLRPSRRSALVSVADDLATVVGHRCVPPRRRPRVVRNGVVVPPDAVPRRRRPGEPLSLVAVGNLYPVKNHGLLIEAAARLRARGVSLQLWILGRGAEEAALSAAIDTADLGGTVRLEGFRSDVPAYLERAHLFVSSSRSEGMPLSFLEAMARGLPVVATAVGGVGEIVEHGVAGLLYPSGDVEAAVSAIRRLADDESLRLRLGCAALEDARRRFSVDAMVDRYLEVYGSLLGTD